MTDTVANRVAQMRQAAGQTQQEVADAVSVSRQTIIAIERGNYTPSVALALKLAHHFHTSTDKVFFLSHEVRHH